MSHLVLEQAIIYLAAGVVFVPIAKRLGLGSVLGYLIAGMVIGPAVLGLIGEEGKGVMHVAEFGVVIMLFLVGLELEPELLWKLRVPVVGLGGLQVLLTSLVVGGGAILVGLPWQEALAIGMVMAMSSTAIVLQTMTEKGLIQTPAGQSTFSVLLFQDIAVIPILAILPLLATFPVEHAGEGAESESMLSGLPSWVQPLAVVGAVLIVVLLGRFVMRPVFRTIARTGLREVFIASAFLLVGGVAWLMESVGLSPALGAFVSGVVLANSEYKHELESDISPFRGLLLGLFFISVGASVDFSLILDNPLLIVGLVLGLMTIKAIVLGVLGNRFKLAKDQNLIFALGLSQVGEFAFVLLSFTQQNGILNDYTAGVLTAVVAISMALTPILFLLTEKVLLPRLTRSLQPEKEADQIEEKNPVIIAGFDNFNNVVGRFLRANGVGTTVLDFDADRVEILRKIGLKVYYGDASRYDLLHSAGAHEAKIIVIALESAHKSLELVKTVKKHFPNLTIFVRAHDRGDAYDFLGAGVEHIYRETLDTSLRTGVDVMRLLGGRAYYAERSARLFRRHDEDALQEQAGVRGDRSQYFDTTRRRIKELEELIRSDETDRWLREVDEGWDNESLRKEMISR
ncbi:monovalent cation:proton antiporter-2 (CPA2) family protein [Spirosoma endophyticum]|uniref:Kef-type potassium/proton antiporter, CPA2 family n=1 Tax=Spirosoma endophyticum TaxID=662367 RepID=A0A1I1GXG0_9BACT|nr:monovalent cation:proton antiporter-2 (CPA2) family protein [Spirosoma endophyticum]SFC16497.1 Kef-type potassium/proton antiporter, CPA2 family [Spirosoma endophyticum]